MHSLQFSIHRLLLKRLRATPLALALGVGLVASSLPAPALVLAAPQTFVVNTTADSDGACEPAPGDCSLREAIAAVNTAPAPGEGSHKIAFAIPGQGVQTIQPLTELPQLRAPVLIDGYSQPGSRQNSAAEGTNALLLIELDGSQAGAANGLVFGNDSRGVIQGLIINSFALTGIRTEISEPGDTGNNVGIHGNFIGTDATGAIAQPNGVAGVLLDAPQTASRIGVSNQPSRRNLISGNGGGIAIGRGSADIGGNLIGTDRTGTKPLGNATYGVQIRSGQIVENTIAFNGADGVQVLANSTVVGQNVIENNGELGIDLGNDGPTPNDQGDEDIGPNGLQNFPVLTSAVSTDGRTIISGTLNSLPNQDYTVELFSNANSGDIEASSFLGAQVVTTDGTGDAGFTLEVDRERVNRAITATATNRINGATSEIAAPVIVTGEPAPPDPGQDPGQQGRPELTSALSPKKQKGKKGKKAKQTIITGVMRGKTNREYTLDFLAGDEQRPVGQTSVTTDGNGEVQFRHTVRQRLVGQAIVAQATDTTTGDTSERSSAVTGKQAKQGKKGKQKKQRAQAKDASAKKGSKPGKKEKEKKHSPKRQRR